MSIVFVDNCDCEHCMTLRSILGRRLYLDDTDKPYVILDHERRLSPILIAKKHESFVLSRPDWIVPALEDIRLVCTLLFGPDFSLRVEERKGHFSIESLRFPALLDVSPST